MHKYKTKLEVSVHKYTNTGTVHKQANADRCRDNSPVAVNISNINYTSLDLRTSWHRFLHQDR